MPESKVEEAHIKIINLIGLTCTDQTRRFLVRSMSVNNCVMVLYDNDVNVVVKEKIPK